MTKVAALHVYFKEFREPVKKSVENSTLVGGGGVWIGSFSTFSFFEFKTSNFDNIC